MNGRITKYHRGQRPGHRNSSNNLFLQMSRPETDADRQPLTVYTASRSSQTVFSPPVPAGRFTFRRTYAHPVSPIEENDFLSHELWTRVPVSPVEADTMELDDASDDVHASEGLSPEKRNDIARDMTIAELEIEYYSLERQLADRAVAQEMNGKPILSAYDSPTLATYLQPSFHAQPVQQALVMQAPVQERTESRFQEHFDQPATSQSFQDSIGRQSTFVTRSAPDSATGLRDNIRGITAGARDQFHRFTSSLRKTKRQSDVQADKDQEPRWASGFKRRQ